MEYEEDLGMIVIFAASSFAAEITGLIGDSYGAKRKAATAADAKCATACMKNMGEKAVLVTSEGK